jgi:hypothetical protein
MDPEAIIISNKDEPALIHLLRALREQKIGCQEIIYTIDRLKEINLQDFRGFFIFCIPPPELKQWLCNLEKKILNHFKIYSYDYLVEDDINSSVFLIFDYIIAGEQEYSTLIKHLQFLKYNYWRKIPFTKLGLQKAPDSRLISKLFHLLERIDVNSTSLQQLSKELKVSKAELQLKIKKYLNINYSQLKSLLIQHYGEYYQNNFVRH